MRILGRPQKTAVQIPGRQRIKVLRCTLQRPVKQSIMPLRKGDVHRQVQVLKTHAQLSKNQGQGKVKVKSLVQ